MISCAMPSSGAAIFYARPNDCPALAEVIVVRGFIPDGLRSGPKTCHCDLSGIPRAQDLRLLHSRSGMNPLTTGSCLSS